MTTLRSVPTEYISHNGQRTQGHADVRTWTQREAFKRGFKKSAKIVGLAFALTLPGALLEPFLFLIWGGILAVILFGFVGPFLHFRFAAEQETVEKLHGPCPFCTATETLTPFLTNSLKPHFKIHCGKCGHNSDAVVSPGNHPTEAGAQDLRT